MRFRGLFRLVFTRMCLATPVGACGLTTRYLGMAETTPPNSLMATELEYDQTRYRDLVFTLSTSGDRHAIASKDVRILYLKDFGAPYQLVEHKQE